MILKSRKFAALALGTALAGFVLNNARAETSPDAVLDHYADMAEAAYSDSLAAAQTLDAKIEAMMADPSPETLKAAREAWLAARNPYQETEVFRFGNEIVDDWEGRVNSWPLDEGLIDYVDADYYGSESDQNTLYTANVIANETIAINGKDVEVKDITPELISGTL